jgi:hypothetical protein
MRIAVVGCLWIALVACRDERLSEPSEALPLLALPPTLPSAFRSDARLAVAHSGIRRFEFPSVAGPAGAYRERITTDGHGRFALEPIDSGEFEAAQWEFFELQQRAHEGFLFRYRDFQVRDPRLFVRNWETTLLVPSTFVAERACQRYRLERKIGNPTFHEVSVDEETGLVLASQEYGVDGQLLAAMSYESFEGDPALGFVSWHVSSNEEVALDPDGPLPENEAALLSPRVLPLGYLPVELATVGNGAGERWLKRTYSDGLTPLFFLQQLRLRVPSVQATGPRQEVSSIAVFELGAARVAQGRVQGFDLIVIGRAAEAELLDLIESALP